MFLEIAENPQADWGTLLSHYTRSFKQLESLLEDIDPLFHLNEVIPTKVTEHPALIPYLLSTQVEKQPSSSSSADSIDTAPAIMPRQDERTLASSLTEYNDNLEELVVNLPNKRRKYE
jgi:hypothetical protein